MQQIDDGDLVALAKMHSVTICLLRAVGEFVPEGADLLEVHGADVPDAKQLRGAVHLGNERSSHEDVGFGLRQLVDIAERALSPGVNDPTTAVQVIDQLHDLLRQLATRPLPPRQALMYDGRLALHVPQPDFAGYLTMPVEEIAHWAADDARVQRRLLVMLRDLDETALPQHRHAVAQVRSLVGSDDPYCIDDNSTWPASDVGLR